MYEVYYMKQKVVVAGVFVILMGLFGSPGWCDDTREKEEVSAIQNRIFHRSHEIDLDLGYIADDDFFNVYPVGLGYSFHFNENIAWEVIRAQYMINSDKDLKKTLQDEFNVQPERFPEQQYMLHSHFVYKPLYGKHSFLNKGVINNEIFFFVGPGLVQYEWEYSTGETDSETAFSLSFGAGLKYFLTQNWCLNVEVRDLMNFREDDTENNIYLGLGIGFRFDLSPRKVKEDPTVKKLKRILNDS
jgi:outer membrane beta-barrel protein